MMLKVVLGIATVGRPTILAETLEEAAQQVRQPDRVIVCGSGPQDVAGIAERFGKTVEIVLASKGLPIQRNAILDAAPDADLVVFIDDDFLMQPDYIQVMVEVFEQEPDTVVTTGHMVADGIIGPGITLEEGRQLLREDLRLPRPEGLEPAFAGYGCNMVVQAAVARRHGVRFDPRLPLYGWQEDVDMTRRLAVYGTMHVVRRARGVHLGVKHGRGSGTRLGYSQIANPLYLHWNSDYPLGFALRLMARNVASNLARSLKPEPYVDRRGRLRGNLIAVRDLLRRRLVPERILEL
jgi:GT2 family glycosyltransferase